MAESVRTVDWLAEVLYDANLKAARYVAHVGAFPWEDLSEAEREVTRRGLTAALEALGDPCLLKLREGEPIFVLRAQDQVSPASIEDWWRRAVEAGMPHTGDKAARAGLKISAFKAWQHEHADVVKIPD